MFNKIFIALLILVLVSFGRKNKQPLTTIAFGSCDHQYNPNKLWDEINAENPQLFIWGGDIIYGDTYNMDTLKHKYNLQKSHPGYQKLLANTMITGTYDDHDYGVNDGGKNYPHKKESRDLLFDFLDVKKKDRARKKEGAYSSYTYGPKGKQVKVLNLDTRYFRDSLEREKYINPNTNKEEFRYKMVEGRDILGEEQWAWLEKELKNSKAEINIINSSIQVISSEHAYEKWANFPTAQKRLYDLIASSTAKRIMIISGDRHIAELSKIQLEGMDYPLYDLTASGLTHTWSVYRPEANSHRVGELIAKRNYGLIQIVWNENPQVTFKVSGQNREVYAEHKLELK